jgi:hypothetical protein
MLRCAGLEEVRPCWSFTALQPPAQNTLACIIRTLAIYLRLHHSKLMCMMLGLCVPWLHSQSMHSIVPGWLTCAWQAVFALRCFAASLTYNAIMLCIYDTRLLLHRDTSRTRSQPTSLHLSMSFAIGTCKPAEGPISACQICLPVLI